MRHTKRHTKRHSDYPGMYECGGEGVSERTQEHENKCAITHNFGDVLVNKGQKKKP